MAKGREGKVSGHTGKVSGQTGLGPARTAQPSRRLLAALLGAVLASGCVHVEENTRVERGPLLRTFTRPEVMDGGVRGTVQVDWPQLTATVEGYDTCRDVTVEEYAEEHVTEHVSPAAGPAFSTGISGTLAGLGLLVASAFVSAQPNTSTIDAQGHYGPSLQQQFRVGSVVGLAVGVPAVVVAVVSMLSSGEESRLVKEEQVVGQRDTACHLRPFAQTVWLQDVHSSGRTQQQVPDAGVVAFTGLGLDYEPEHLDVATGLTPPNAWARVELEPDDAARLDAFGGCAQLAFLGAVEPRDALDDQLLERAQLLQRCQRVRGGELKAEIAAVEAELQTRREQGAPGTSNFSAPLVHSWQDAVTMYAPQRRLKAASVDLQVLDSPVANQGTAFILEGVLENVVSEHVAVLRLGDRDVLLFLPPRRPWGGAFTVGSRLETVAVFGGLDELQGHPLPYFQAVWVRSAY